MKITRIISAVNDNNLYLSFIPIITKIWKIIADIDMDIAVVSDDTNLVMKVGRYCNPHHYNLTGIDAGIQAKVSRMILASDYEDDICMLVDVDMIPLNRKVIEVFAGVPDNHLAQWGYDHPVYHGVDAHKWPMDRTTASGRTFHEIINPNGYGYKQLLKSWYNFGYKTSVNSDFKRFSDESLLSKLVSRWPRNNDITKLPRTMIEGKFGSGRLDRTKSWNNITCDEYFECHGIRPFKVETYIEIIKHFGLEGNNLCW